MIIYLFPIHDMTIIHILIRHIHESEKTTSFANSTKTLAPQKENHLFSKQ